MTIKNGDLPAMPMWCEQLERQLHGLTKREMFAMAAMQGFLSSLAPDEAVIGKSLAMGSVAVADELLAELERTK